MADEEIMSNALDEENLEAKEDKDGDLDILVKPICPQSGDVRQALGVVRRCVERDTKIRQALECVIFSDIGECIHKCINRINLIVENKLSKHNEKCTSRMLSETA